MQQNVNRSDLYSALLLGIEIIFLVIQSFPIMASYYNGVFQYWVGLAFEHCFKVNFQLKWPCLRILKLLLIKRTFSTIAIYRNHGLIRAPITQIKFRILTSFRFFYFSINNRYKLIISTLGTLLYAYYSGAVNRNFNAVLRNYWIYSQRNRRKTVEKLRQKRKVN